MKWLLRKNSLKNKQLILLLSIIFQGNLFSREKGENEQGKREELWCVYQKLIIKKKAHETEKIYQMQTSL